MKRRSALGLTLIELMVVVAIVAILGALAVPSYRQYVTRSNRTEAINELLNLAACQERIYQRLNAYNAASCGGGATINSLYTMAITTQNTNQNFVITATPLGSQLANDTCGNLTFSDQGVKGSSGAGDAAQIATCWKGGKI